MTSSPHGPYVSGLHTSTMARYKAMQTREWKQIPEIMRPSSDCRLQLACMKPESLVTAGQLYRGEYVLGALYTPPVKPRESGAPEVAVVNPQGRSASKVNSVIGTKS